MIELNKDEKAAIDTLKRLSKRWPKSLWLFSASGTLCVMRKDMEGRRVELPSHGGVDPDYLVTTVKIENDGGDW